VYADITTENLQADSQVLHPGSRRLFRNWEMLRAESPCPGRGDFSLAPLKDLVPNLFILEQRKVAHTCNFRLAGSDVCTILGANVVGHNVLNGWDSFERRLIEGVLLAAFEKKQPALLRVRLTRKSQAVLGAECIALPFIAAQKSIHLIGGLFPFAKLPAEDDTIQQRELIAVRTLWTEFGTGDTLLRSVEQKGHPLLRVIDGGLSNS